MSARDPKKRGTSKKNASGPHRIGGDLTMPTEQKPEPQGMPPMIAYAVNSSLYANDLNKPFIVIDVGAKKTRIMPDNAQQKDDSYWIVVMDSKNPRVKLKDWVVPAAGATVPPDMQSYFDNPSNIFAVATQYLSTLHVPQGPFFDFLTKYGAGRELQRLEQVNASLGCGAYGRISYVLTSLCGKREPGQRPPRAMRKARPKSARQFC
jgi:hypothetical protein